jgi:hypothetical protein
MPILLNVEIMSISTTSTRVLQAKNSAASTPSSIGPIGRIETETQLTSQRRKGFITTVIATEQDARDFVDNILRKELKGITDSGEISRLNLRVIANSELLNKGIFPKDLIEAVIKLNWPNTNDAYSIVYFGYNNAGRSIAKSERTSFETSIKTLMPSSRREDVTTSEKLHTGITFKRATAEELIQSQQVAVLNMLNEHFGYNTSEAESIIRDSRYILFVAIGEKGDVAGMSMGEEATIYTNTGNKLRMIEITNGAVIPEYGGNGLYASISSALISYLAKDLDIDLVYSESNLERPTLLKAIGQQGRRYAGILPNNSVVDNGFRSMVVTYLTREDLNQITLSQMKR